MSRNNNSFKSCSNKKKVYGSLPFQVKLSSPLSYHHIPPPSPSSLLHKISTFGNSQRVYNFKAISVRLYSFKFWRDQILFPQSRDINKDTWSLESEKCHTKTPPHTHTPQTDLSQQDTRWQRRQGPGRVSRMKPLHLPLIFQVVLQKLRGWNRHLGPGAPGGVRWHTGKVAPKAAKAADVFVLCLGNHSFFLQRLSGCPRGGTSVVMKPAASRHPFYESMRHS